MRFCIQLTFLYLWKQTTLSLNLGDSVILRNKCVFQKAVIVLCSAGRNPLYPKGGKHAIPSDSSGMVALEFNQEATRGTVQAYHGDLDGEI